MRLRNNNELCIYRNNVHNSLCMMIKNMLFIIKNIKNFKNF